MLSSSGSRPIAAFQMPKAYQISPTQNHITSPSSTSQYDSSSFSTISDEARRFHMDTVGRLTQEVRTATTTGKIQELRKAVTSGEYVPDPAEIAKRMLFFPEE